MVRGLQLDENIKCIFSNLFSKQIRPSERCFEPHGPLSLMSMGKISQTYIKSVILPFRLLGIL